MKKKNLESLNENKNIKNPIVDALYEYIDDFNLKFAETKEAFKKARLSTSDRKEAIVKDFFSSFFPPGYEISRGEIFDYDSISNSIDCVIKTPDHPKLKTPMRPEIILAEGVYAAIEVKPDLSTKKEFNRVIKQCKSVKKINRNIDMKQVNLYDKKKTYKKIPFIIFSKKAKDIEETAESIISLFESGKLEIYEVPDVIFSLDGWLLYHTVNIRTSLFFHSFIQNGVPENSENVFMGFKGSPNDLLCVLLLILFNFPGHGYIVNEYIIKNYLLRLYKDGVIKTEYAIWSDDGN